jgi:hypothetical protein
MEYIRREKVMTFECWFKELVELSETKFGGIINKEDPESYREYFDDEDTPAEVIDTEISYMLPETL